MQSLRVELGNGVERGISPRTRGQGLLGSGAFDSALRHGAGLRIFGGGHQPQTDQTRSKAKENFFGLLTDRPTLSVNKGYLVQISTHETVAHTFPFFMFSSTK